MVLHYDSLWADEITCIPKWNVSIGNEFHNNITGSGTKQRKHLCCQCCHAPDTVRNKLQLSQVVPWNCQSEAYSHGTLSYSPSVPLTTLSEAYLSEIEKAWERKSSGQCIRTPESRGGFNCSQTPWRQPDVCNMGWEWKSNSGSKYQSDASI